MNEKWNLIVDVSLCINCHNCVLANKDEHIGNDFPGYSVAQPPGGLPTIEINRVTRGDGPAADVSYVPKLCNHCDDAPCIKAGNGAVRKRDDGIVLIDPARAKGRRDLVESCPYGMIQWNEDTQQPQHWTFDAHLLDQGWQMPRAVHACPTGALHTLQASDEAMAKRVESEDLRVLNPEFGTKPRVYYRHAERFLSLILRGNILTRQERKLECAESLRVLLHRQNETVAETSTDSFGDFCFDGIDPNSGTYIIELINGDKVLHECEVTMNDSQFVEIIIDQES